MKRLALAKLVKQRLKADDIVVCGLGATEAAFKEAVPINPTYYASDPMGLWASIALGLALALPTASHAARGGTWTIERRRAHDAVRLTWRYQDEHSREAKSFEGRHFQAGPRGELAPFERKP